MQAIPRGLFSGLSIWKKISATPAELIEFCRGRLAHFKYGKIRKNILRAESRANRD